MNNLVKVFSATDIGIGRTNNEDDFAIIPHSTYLVADGMGGYTAGEVASSIMKETAIHELSNKTSINEQDLIEVIKKGNQTIIDKSSEIPQYAGMGTTVTMVHINENDGIWANVGDSRTYLIHNRQIQQLTKDHSFVADLIENGSISKDDVKKHPRRNLLTRAVGVDRNIKVDTGKFSFCRGDSLLLCSDGLTAVLDDQSILRSVTDNIDGDLATCLINEALSLGSRDNITVIAIVNY